MQYYKKYKTLCTDVYIVAHSTIAQYINYMHVYGEDGGELILHDRQERGHSRDHWMRSGTGWGPRLGAQEQLQH
jgi:hypothetical protein